MDDVTETIDPADDSERNSRRDRWKDAISRTKSKFKKDKVIQPAREDFKLSDDVNDFLAAGRKVAATVTTGPVTDQQAVHDVTAHRSAPAPAPVSTTRQPSPRAAPIPHLDVSQSQRWPHARTMGTDPGPRIDDHLAPTFTPRQNPGRSHSFQSALAKNRTKPRGLSVTFVNALPTIIGEGGDEAEAPTCEISRGRDRSRSLSPYIDRPSNSYNSDSNSRSPVRRKPVPPSPPPPSTTIQNPDREDSIFQPKPFRRVQTGFSEQQQQIPYDTKPLGAQLQQALKLNNQDPFRDPFVNPQERQDQLLPSSLAGRQASVADPLDAQSTGNFQGHRLSVQSDRSSRSRSSFNSLNSPTSPNVQQSRETSYKSPPPKVRNFYAELTQQSSPYSIESEKQPIVYQIQESVVRPQYHGQLMSSPADMTETVAKQVQNMHQSPPEGWI